MARSEKTYLEKVGAGYYQGDIPSGRPIFNQRINLGTPTFNNNAQAFRKVDDFETAGYTQPGDSFTAVTLQVVDPPAPEPEP